MSNQLPPKAQTMATDPLPADPFHLNDAEHLSDEQVCRHPQIGATYSLCVTTAKGLSEGFRGRDSTFVAYEGRLSLMRPTNQLPLSTVRTGFPHQLQQGLACCGHDGTLAGQLSLRAFAFQVPSGKAESTRIVL